MRNVDISGILLFYFILLDSPKKQTNKQTERTLAGTPQQLWLVTVSLDTKKKKNKNKN